MSDNIDRDCDHLFPYDYDTMTQLCLVKFGNKSVEPATGVIWAQMSPGYIVRPSMSSHESKQSRN